MWKFVTARHIQKAHKRYNEKKPSLKEIYQFLNNLKFDQPFLRYVSSIDGRIRSVRVHIVPFEGFSKKPSAAMPITRAHIVLNPEWAAKLYYNAIEDIKTATMEQLQKSADTEDELLVALGHEMGHIFLDHGSNSPLLPRKRKRFINWVNEVFADFFALDFAMEKDRKKTLAAMKRKQAYRKKDKSTVYHPSYELRMKYIENFEFDERLIEEIAKDCGMNEKWMIRKVLDWYGCDTRAVL